MAISVNCSTKVISVPKADLTPVSAGLYSLSVEDFRLWLRDWEDSETGMAMPDTHNRNAPVTLSGATYAQTFEITNGYTVTFENGSYRVRVVGGNHNIADVMTANSVSIEVGNSAGLIAVSTGGGGSGGPTAAEVAAAVWAWVVEAGMPAEGLLRVLLAAMSGTTTGIGGSTESYKSVDGSKVRITVVFDGSGNRLSTTLDAS